MPMCDRPSGGHKYNACEQDRPCTCCGWWEGGWPSHRFRHRMLRDLRAGQDSHHAQAPKLQTEIARPNRVLVKVRGQLPICVWGYRITVEARYPVAPSCCNPTYTHQYTEQASKQSSRPVGPIQKWGEAPFGQKPRDNLHLVCLLCAFRYAGS